MSLSLNSSRILACAIFLFLASGRSLHAQDSRNVSEPKFPPACTTLAAQLSIVSGGPSSETAFDTSRIQAALNGCTPGSAVELVASGTLNAFLTQPFTLPTGVTLLIDGGVTLYGSRNPADYQNGSVSSTQEACGTIGTRGNGCGALIKTKGTTGSGIMGYGVIDGRGPNNLIVNGVTQNYSFYSNTLQAYTTSPIGSQNNPEMITAEEANNFTLYKITLKNSPLFNLHWEGQNGSSTATSGLTIWGIKIVEPYNVPNTDGIDPTDNATDITITNSFISNGDDQVAISSTAVGNPVSNVSVTNLHTYSGRGVSIGSYTEGGINNVLVDTINQAGYYADSNGNGFRIKSAADRGGIVNNITFQHICQENEAHAIRFDPFYTKSPANTNFIPTFSNVTVRDVTVLANPGGGSGRFIFEGYDANHLTTLTLDNFNVLGTPDVTTNKPENVDFSLGPGPVSPTSLQQLTGTAVTYSGNVADAAETHYACSSANFQRLTGELFISVASATNLQTISTSSPATLTLNAVLQPASAEYPSLTNPITFYDGNTAVGTASLGGNGTLATLSLSGVSGGTHTYTAVYPGDSSYAAFSFGSVSVVTPGSSGAPPSNPTPPPTPPNPTSTNGTVTISATPSSLSLTAGSTASSALTITPVNGFTGSVTLSCSSPVAYITCKVSAPGTISGSAVNATATISVGTATTSLATSGDRTPNNAPTPVVLATAFPLGVLLLLQFAQRRRYSLSALAVVLLMGVALVAGGCIGTASSVSVSHTTPNATQNSQVIKLTATAGSTVASTTLTVTIN
jgi:Glycosyl hydrolases family 28/Bacterial Ig-like domain (group 3)